MGLILPLYIERPPRKDKRDLSGYRRGTSYGYDYDRNFDLDDDEGVVTDALELHNDGHSYSYSSSNGNGSFSNYSYGYAYSPSRNHGNSHNHSHSHSRSRNSRNSRSLNSARAQAAKLPFRTYVCRNCRTHISSTHEIISQQYRGKDGDAYLMSRVANVCEGASETRTMFTGDYVVCDIECQWCHAVVGWKYLISQNHGQRYKEGRYVMELERVALCST
ncbi:Moh1 protein [Maudiozyma humilis]|uniref:Moh1 protein n=1 Tax=Maudiozyma humilis TaxID=51915 RepID=A0AAV5RW42_MAUHU|nr:Moh1 protein [Kazachstania humilis]